MSGCIVRVFGVPKYISKNDLEIYFQSKKKSGGGELDDIEFDPDRGEARIAFKESSAAKRVLGMANHKYKAASLTVTEEMTSPYEGGFHSGRLLEEELEDNECASVVVSGLSAKTTKDAIQMYFENARRSHGGDVKSVELNDDQAVVTFESPEVAKTVLEWGKHTLDGCPLTVTKPVPPKKSPPSNEDEIEQTVQRSRIVRVTGISDKTTKDALLNFFENTRRSGGGEIDDIQHVPEERLADITFCSPDDAERVSEKKGLELDGSKLTLKLKEIPKEIPKDPYKLHVVGIGEKTTKDGLVSFMEVVSQEEVDSIFFGSNSNAMVTFKEPPDTEKVQKKCSTRALDGSHLKIEQVNICDCIEVRGLAPNTTKDTVFYYFDNPRNSGGEVKNVELDSNDTRALVFFEDPSVVGIVIKRKHKINGAKLQVVPFYPFLGEPSADPGGGKKERVVKVDPQAVEFINKFARLEFDHLLEERRVKYTWLQDSKEIVLGSTEPKMDKKTWEKSTEPVVAYVKQIVTEKITVSREAWDEMYKKSKEKCASFKDQVAVTCKEKECSFTLTGKQRDVSVFAEQLNDLKSEIEKQLEFEKNTISKSIELSEAQLQLLSLSGLVEDLQARYKDLEVKLSKKDGTINFKGPDLVVKEGNITVWQTLSRIKELELELPKSIVAVVSSQPGKVLLATKLKKENIDAVVNCDPNSDNQLLVTAVDRKDAKKAAELVKDLTSEQTIHLNDHQKRLMNSEKWNQLKRSIQQSMLLEVREEPAASTLWIAGIKEEVDHAKEKVEKFFEENIILDQVINAESGRLKFIFRCKKDTIQSLEKSFANQSVKITKETDKGSKVSALVVNGTRDGIQKVVPKVQKLLEEIKDRKVDLDKPGMKKLFSQKKGMNLLSIVENDHECVIEKCTPADRRQSFSRSNSTKGNKSSSKLICSFFTPEEKTILLYKGDLTEQPVDVMVNAANGKLDHIGGLAKNIVVKGGREIQDECNDHVLRNGSLLDGEVFVSKPGKLPCKRIVHAVGPDWRSYQSYNRPRALDEEKKVRLLGQTVYRSLEEAEMFSSIAVPAISGGVFGCPADVCAKTLIESVLEYSEENSSCKLSEIRFVDMNDSVIKAFHDEMKRKFGKEHSFSDGAKPKAEAKSVHNGKVTVRGRRRGRSKAKELADEPVKDEPVRDEPATSLESESAAVYDDPNALTTALGMKILVIVGDLAKEEAHVIVNTVSSDLDLGKNACAKALSNAAGPQLQQECKAKGSLSAGQMLVTDGYNLGCKNVFHVVAGNWQSGQGESILRSLLQSCFKEADQRGFSSIAFPAIGTGNLAFPRDVVAKAFFEEADSFKSGNPQSPLNEIHLVLFHKDQPTIKAFQDELRSRKPKVAKGKRRSYAPKSEDDEGPSSREPIENYVTISQEDASGSSYIGSVRLEIVPGDITNETTDAIVTVSNPSLNVSFGGGVGAAIAKAGGPSIQQECNKLGQQKPGSVVSTSAGNLPTKYIFHLAVVSTSFVSQGISDVMVKCFRKADEMGIKSIAVPAVGTGMGGRSPKDAAKALLSAIGKFSQENPTSLKHIRIVIFQETILPVFDSAIDDLSQSKSSLLATIWKGFKAGVKGMFGFGESATGSYEPLDELPENGATDLFHKEDKMWLQVYAESDKILSKAEIDIHKLVQENSKVKDIDNKAIGKLSDAQRNRVMTMEATHDVKIQINKRIDNIVIRGVAEDVYNATTAIYDILNETTEEEHSRRYAELLSKNIQWYYEDGDKFEPYDEKTNARIEYAYQDKKTSVLISLRDDDELVSYEIDLTAMEEKNPDTGETIRVERRDKTAGIPLPTHWDPQPKDSNGKEEDLHMVVLDPVKHKKEYDEVKLAMQKTASVNIVKIERVQNPGLYKTYAVKKQKMDDQNGSNEMKLFHGTPANTCQLINHKGFNRSFCGKNATAFGKGVYFARDASYSASSTYSPPDSAGNRYMYMASVLVGDYTTGQSNMITPPPKNPNNATITYDTVVNNTTNPSIFVVFHDTQNYPDYLITFR